MLVRQASAFAAFGKELPKLVEQQREVCLYGLPDYFEIDVAIVVNDAIAHPGDLSKRNAGKLVAGLDCQAGRSFPATRKRRKTASCVFESFMNSSRVWPAT